ncbi:MAG: metalloregulator ArsR/SmtB family transcription factor [Gammaproteobacteria bacterium]|nr:metalloregulator ArsR/SmtB family transcription factor [Gammaproteobacteria bacterium]
MLATEEFFPALADTTRLRCLLLLAAEDELCVCELMHALGESQPKISRHLATLREMNVVADRRAGQWIYYRLHPELPPWARGVLQQALKGAAKAKPHKTDLRALKTMPNRPNGMRCCK